MTNPNEMIQSLLDQVASGQLSRRRFMSLAGAASLPAGFSAAMLDQAFATGDNRAANQRNMSMTFTIDVHHHILPDVFWRATNDAHSPVGGISPPPWSKETTLSYMDDAGIDVAITSISTPGVHMGDDSAARDLARRVNELSAELIQERPDRFGGFAALPLPDVEGALRELEYALDTLKLDGVILFSNARGIYLGDSRFRPLFNDLERRGAVVFVHPTLSPDPAAHSLGLPDTLIDFTADTTRAVAQLHYGNTFARTPNVKYIFSHAGGTIPYLAARFSVVDEMNVIPGGEERGTAADTFRRLYWDTAVAWRPPVLRVLHSVVGMGQVLFGTDYPYLRRDLAVACRHDVETSAELASEESHAVLADNALRLFPRLAASARTDKANAQTPGTRSR
jgi:6-methylsalicylate decarboxylase